MSRIHDEAVVLRKLDFSEHSQVLVLFGRQSGKVRAIAKGIKRSTRARFAPAIDLLDVGRIVVSGAARQQQQLAVLTEWKQILGLIELRRSLAGLYAAQYAAAITGQLTEDWDPHPPVYDALLELLKGLADGAAPLAEVLRYQCTLLTHIGSMPRLDVCVGCGCVPNSQQMLHFSSLDGGLVCRDCESTRSEKRQLTGGVLEWMVSQRGDHRALPEAVLTVDYHLSHLMGRRLRLCDLLLSVCR